MQLATQRLLLRELAEDDWLAVWAYQSNPLYLRYYVSWVRLGSFHEVFEEGMAACVDSWLRP